MRNQQINWHEGLFLRPHHFQSADRYWHELIGLSSRLDQGYNYGLFRFELNEQALDSQILEVVRCEARSKFGTIFSFDNSYIDRVDLNEKLENDSKFVEFLRDRGGIRVFLGVPHLKLTRPNVMDGSQANGHRRFQVEANQFEDEATGGNPEDVSCRALNMKLLFESDDLEGFEAIPLFRLVRSRDLDGKLGRDREYFPPCLSTKSYPDLQRDIMEAAYDLLKSRGEILRRQVVDNGWNFATQVAGAVDRLMLLRTINAALGTLNCYSFADGIHPLDAYAALCELIGRLSIFGNDKSMGDLPRYDHEDLHTIFRWALDRIRGLVDIGDEGYFQRFFKGSGRARLRVNIESEWFSSKWQLILGIHSIDLSSRECLSMLDRTISWKLAQPSFVDYCYEKQARGLKLRSLKNAPAVLPRTSGWTFFSIAADDLWDEVQAEGAIGLRINSDQVQNLAELEGQQTIALDNKGTPARVEFAIFAVRENE